MKFSTEIAELQRLLRSKEKEFGKATRDNNTLTERLIVLTRSVYQATAALQALQQCACASGNKERQQGSSSAAFGQGRPPSGSLCAHYGAVNEMGRSGAVQSRPDLSPSTSASSCQCSSGDAPEIVQREQEIQQLLQKLGACSIMGEVEGLRTSRVLRGLLLQPQRVQQLCSMSPAVRLQWFRAVIHEACPLVTRYEMASSDNRGAAQSWPINPKQQLEQMVDEGAGALLVWGLLDQHCHLTTLIGMNMNTLQHEPYPEGWWKEAAKAIQFTAEQKATLQAVWVNVSKQKTSLLQQHAALSLRLLQLQLGRKAKLQDFEQQAQQLFEQGHRALCTVKARRTADQHGDLLKPQEQQLHHQQQQQQQQQRSAGHQQLQPSKQLSPNQAGGGNLRLPTPVGQQRQEQVCPVAVLPMQAEQSLPVRPCQLSPQVRFEQQQQQQVQHPSVSLLLGQQLGQHAADADGQPALKARQQHEQCARQLPVGCGAPLQLSDDTRRLAEDAELLLGEGSSLEVALQDRMAKIMQKLSQLYVLLCLHMQNTLTTKQAALYCLSVYPYIPENWSLFEALDELGW